MLSTEAQLILVAASFLIFVACFTYEPLRFWRQARRKGERVTWGQVLCVLGWHRETTLEGRYGAVIRVEDASMRQCACGRSHGFHKEGGVWVEPYRWPPPEKCVIENCTVVGGISKGIRLGA